jgi:hypothetical protein
MSNSAGVVASIALAGSEGGVNVMVVVPNKVSSLLLTVCGVCVVGIQQELAQTWVTPSSTYVCLKGRW